MTTKGKAGSGRDAVPFQGDLVNLGWLEQHISHTERSSKFNRVDSKMDAIAAEVDTADTTIWKLKIHNCSMSRIGLYLRCRGLVSYDKHDRCDRYNYMETRL